MLLFSSEKLYSKTRISSNNFLYGVRGADSPLHFKLYGFET